MSDQVNGEVTGSIRTDDPESTNGRISTPASGTAAERILTYIDEWSHARNLRSPPDSDTSFFRAGFDSLHALELAHFLARKLDVRISETILYDYATPAALVTYLVRALDERASAGTQ